MSPASRDVQSTESELRALLSGMQERTITYERALPGMLIGGGLLSSYLSRVYTRMNTSLRHLRDTITITSYNCVYVHTFCVPILVSTTSSASVIVSSV